jgi:hypothetical protein
MRTVTVFVLALATVTFAQEQPEPASQSAESAQGTQARSPVPLIARLRVYRQPKFSGSALYPSIYVDGRQVARVGNGRRVTIKLTPGSHNIKSDDNGSAITLDATAGQDYYVRVDEVQGMMKGKGKVTLMPSGQGAPEYSRQRPIEESRKIAPEMIEDFDLTLPARGAPKMQEVPSVPQQPETSATPPTPVTEGLPEGFVLYEGSKAQFTIGIPKDWAAYDQGQTMKAAGLERMTGRFGDMIIFYQSKDSTHGLIDSPELMGKVDTGEVPSFFLQKLPADKGMSCAGFSEKAEKKAIDQIGKDPNFKGNKAMEPAHAETANVGGCKGLRIRAKGQRSPEPPLVADAYVASDGMTLYTFSLRNPADNYEKNVDVFQKAISTLKLSAAK